MTPKSDIAIDMFDRFCYEVRQRLVLGKETYGDSSFEKPLANIVEEIRQEALDLTGWSFILYCRIDELQKNIRQNETNKL